MTRVLPRFPTSVRGINALSATTENGVLEIGIDPTNLAESADPTAPGNYTVILKSTTNELELAEVASTVVDIATKEEAEAGTDNTAINTPLRTTQQVDARLATEGEAESGGSAAKLMTPLTTAEAVQANVYPTRAELLARNLPAVQMRVRTSGYSEPGVGGAEYVLADSEPAHPGKFPTPDGRWWEIAPFQSLPLEAFGAKANDPSFDNTAAINAALQASRKRQISVLAGPWVYHHAGTLIIPQSARCKGTTGRTEFFLSDGSNVTQCETENFDYYLSEDAYNIDDYPDITIGFDFDGVIFNGNRDGQAAPVEPRWGVRLFGHFYNWTNIHIANTSGTGLWTEEGTSTGAFDYTKARSPDKIDNLQITNSLHENWVHSGPTHVGLGRLVTDNSGYVNGDGTPGTSLMFPGEPIHGVRVRAGFHADSCNFNGAVAGRTFMAENNARVMVDRLVTSGGWGQILISSGVSGRIGMLLTQANPYAYGGVVYPHVQNNSSALTFGSVVCRRQGGSDQATAPCVVDSGGTSWGLVKSQQNLAAGGTFFVADNNGISIDHLHAAGPAVVLHTTANCDAIAVDCYFNNVAKVWQNEKNGLTGNFRFRGTLESGQTFETGVLTTTPIDAVSLSKADISFLDNGTRKRNSFRAEAAVDLSTTGGKTVTFTHNMWRTPNVQEIAVGLRQSGFTAPGVMGPPYVTGFSSTQITARIDVGTAATGSVAGQVTCRVNC